MNKMKYSRFWVRAGFLLAGVAWMLSSCAKGPKLEVSTNQVVFEAYPEEDLSIGISANIRWEAALIQKEKWLVFVQEDISTPNPIHGKGNGTIILKASDNTSFNGRSACVIISGDDIQTDTVYISQTGSVDVVEIIEDEAFKKYCLFEFDKTPKDGKLSLQEIQNAAKITITGSNIRSLAGIEYFTGLKELYCAGNNLQSLNLSKNKKMLKLDCSKNPINDLDVSELTELTDLYIDDTNIRTIDVSKNAKLYWLAASGNQMTNIDVSNNMELTIFECNVNQLEAIDLKKNTKLQYLHCTGNKIKTLDLTSNKALERLWCNNNLLTGIDVAQNTELQNISCAENSITNLILKNNTKLSQLYCDANQLGTLDVSANTQLTDMRCTSNKLSNLDVSKNKALTTLYCSYNMIGSLDVTQNTSLQRLECDQNNLATLDVSMNTELIELYCDGNRFTALNLSKNTKLTDFRCTDNHLDGRIDISNNKLLTIIYLQRNPQLAEIKVWQEFNVNSKNYQKDTDAKYVW